MSRAEPNAPRVEAGRAAPEQLPSAAACRPSLAVLGLTVACTLACLQSEDVVGIVIADSTGASSADAGGRDGGTSVQGALVLVGRPLGAAHWPHPIAPWPLSAPLREFFASAPPEGGQRVRVEGAEGELLAELRRAVSNGEYGPQRNAVVAEDRLGERFLLLFQSP